MSMVKLVKYSKNVTPMGSSSERSMDKAYLQEEVQTYIQWYLCLIEVVSEVETAGISNGP